MQRIAWIGAWAVALLLAASAFVLAALVVGAAGPTCQGQPTTIHQPDFEEFGIKHFFGTDGRDVIVGTAEPDDIRGEGGNDLIRVHGGDDFVYGDDGRDRVNGGDGDDYPTGDPGDDVLRGGLGRDELRGKEGDDLCDGGRGTDTAPDTPTGPCEQTPNVP